MKTYFKLTNGKNVAANLTPTTHSKGGEAWTVQIGVANAGVLRRWERTEVRTWTTPTSATIRKVEVVKWSIYLPGSEKGLVYENRTRALRAMHAALNEAAEHREVPR